MCKNKVFKACTDANYVKLRYILDNLKDDSKKEQIKKMFNTHMEELTDFILNDDFFTRGTLTENFIKNLHRKLFPPHYKETKKSLSWKEVVYFIPWEYKKYPNFPRVWPSNVKKEMQYWINDYNTKIKQIENKFDFIALKVVEFLRIHPFANANGITISIIFDLMLIQNWFENFWFKRKYLILWFKDKFFKAIENYILTKNEENYLNFIKKYLH